MRTYNEKFTVTLANGEVFSLYCVREHADRDAEEIAFEAGSTVVKVESTGGFDTPPEKQEIYVPGPVWSEDCAAGPTVSAEEALQLGALSVDLEKGTATWPQHFFDAAACAA
jgi:hypothetical protein